MKILEFWLYARKKKKYIFLLLVFIFIFILKENMYEDFRILAICKEKKEIYFFIISFYFHFNF
jgi:hypothetical protein